MKFNSLLCQIVDSGGTTMAVSSDLTPSLTSNNFFPVFSCIKPAPTCLLRTWPCPWVPLRRLSPCPSVPSAPRLQSWGWSRLLPPRRRIKKNTTTTKTTTLSSLSPFYIRFFLSCSCLAAECKPMETEQNFSNTSRPDTGEGALASLQPQRKKRNGLYISYVF